MRSIGYKIITGQTLVLLDPKCKVLHRLVVPRFICSAQADGEAYCLNPNHGRTIYLGEHYIPCLGGSHYHIFAKGVGLTLNTTPYLLVPKHGRTYYGLCDYGEALREWRHSEHLAKLGITAGRVIGVVKLAEIPSSRISLNQDTDSLPSNFEPCVVYSATRALYRLGDIAYLNTDKRTAILELYQQGFGVCNPQAYMEKLIATVARNVALLHEIGGYNVTAYAHNLTCLGEVVDFEAISIPPKRPLSRSSKINLMQRLEIYNSLEMIVDAAELFGLNWDLAAFARGFCTTYNTHTVHCSALNSVIPRELWNSA